MKIYAIRDRLVDYFMQPFCAPGDNQVKAAVATQVNAEDKNVISQAPHHFEIWSLGEVDELSGKITPERVLLADCNTLVRGSFRESTNPHRIGAAPERRTGAPEATGGNTSAKAGPAQGEAPGRPGAPQEADPGSGRGNH